MLDTIIKGILIGILISAPMGPIGILCIQRTLHQGKLHGFISGLGATFSDLIYAIISGLGVSFILDFIKANHSSLQIVGSIFLLIAGYLIYKSNPVKKLHKANDELTPYWKDFVTSFFLNLSNIGILFLFLAIFARFKFINPNNFTQNIVGLLSIGLGTIIWWFFVSTIIDKLRYKFNPRALKIINNILGVILIIIGFVGLISGTYNIIYS